MKSSTQVTHAASRPLARAIAIAAAVAMNTGCGDDAPAADGSTGAATTSAEGSTTGLDTTQTSTTSASGSGSDTSGSESTSTGDPPSGCEPVGEGLHADLFHEGSLAEEITEEACTLANGVETMCYRVVIAGAPANHEVTTVCPRTIDDEATGLWIIDNEAVPVDGEFIVNLPEIFGDDGWQLYDPETGEVIFTETAEDCNAAGGMPLDPGYANYCVECLFEHIGGPMTMEYLIPVTPTMADTPTEIGMLAPGVSLNGVTIEFPADIATIESNYNIAPFDYCGGHVNFNIGYHYHEELGCIDGAAQCDGHAPLIGYARDGYGIHEMTNEDGQEPADLDPCRGHTDDIRGYHYHAASPGENMFLGCLSGEIVEGAGGPPGGGPGGPGGPPE